TEALALRRQAGDSVGIAGSLGNLGLLAMDRSDYASAAALMEEGLALSREGGHRLFVAAGLLNLGGVALRQRDLSRATALLSGGLTAYAELKHPGAIAECLEA